MYKGTAADGVPIPGKDRKVMRIIALLRKGRAGIRSRMPAFLICLLAADILLAGVLLCASGPGFDWPERSFTGVYADAREEHAGPWVVKADGRTVACVSGRKEAFSVIFGLKLMYADSVSEQLTAELKEKITIERAPQKAYRTGEVVTAPEAVRAIAKSSERKSGDAKPAVTVVSKKNVSEERTVARPVKVIKRSDMDAGVIKVKKRGADGTEHTVSEVTIENGSVAGVEEVETKATAEPESAVVYEGTAPDAKEKGEMVIDCAVRFLGTKYVWGGNDLRNGIDCSGFTKEIYAMFGVELPRHSSAQADFGTEVAYEDARAGDIICYDGHVALYIGEGKIIHATPGEIQFGENAAYRPIVSVRRIFTDEEKIEGKTADQLNFEELIGKVTPNDNTAAEESSSERDKRRQLKTREDERVAREKIEKELSDRQSTMKQDSE